MISGGAWTCYDYVSGDRLDPALVQAACELEIDDLKNMKVYDIVSRKEMKKSGRGKLINKDAGWMSAKEIR